MARTHKLAWLLAAAGYVCLVGAATADPLKIRIAWTTVPGQMTPILFEPSDRVKHQGTSYTVEHVHFAGSGPMVTGLATGEVDIAPLAPSSFGLALQNARLDDLRIISDDYQDGVPGHYSSEFLVRADGPIRAVEDLKGKVLAVNAVGGGSDSALRAMLRRHRLEDRKDYSVVETQFSTMPAMLEEGKVDLISEVLPFSYTLHRDAHVRTLFTARDVFGTTQSLFNVARAGFLEKNRAALNDFFEDYIRSLRWFLAPENRDKAVDIVARFNKRPVALFAPYLFTAEDNYRDPDGRPNLGALQQNMKDQKELGLLSVDVDVKAHADLSFVDEAVRRLSAR
jgi:sulfonate transport system substrate-binding protein